MGFVPVSNTMQIEVRYTWDDQQVENVLYALSPTAITESIMEAAANAVRDNLVVPLLPIQTSMLILREVFVRDLTTETSGQFTLAAQASDIGGSASPSVPNNVTLCVSFRTAKTGRSFRGRNYILGLTEGQVSNNTVNVGTITAITAQYAILRTGLSGEGLTHVVVSRVENGVERAAGLATPIISASVVDAIVDSQRRRLPGRGR